DLAANELDLVDHLRPGFEILLQVEHHCGLRRDVGLSPAGVRIFPDYQRLTKRLATCDKFDGVCSGRHEYGQTSRARRIARPVRPELDIGSKRRTGPHTNLSRGFAFEVPGHAI